MSIISISRGSYSHGKEIAEKVASKLNYECISREILLEASEEFNIEEIRLLRAIKNAPSFLDHFRYGRKKYLAYIRSALLEHVQKDNVVYHGFGGHFLLRSIPNVLKVRIHADNEERAKFMMSEEGISHDEALKAIERIDHERKKWAIHFYDKDPSDLLMYDLALVIGTLSIDEAVDIVVLVSRLPCFQTTTESHERIKDLVLAEHVKATLFGYFPESDVSVEHGTIFVHISRSLAQQEAVADDIRDIVMKIPGIEHLRIDIVPFY